MTMNDSANLPADGGSKTVEPSDIDNPETLNFWEPEDDEANPVAGGEGIVDGEEAGFAGDEADAADGGEEDGPDAGGLDDELVTLKGGEQVPVKELKLGYMRERDYRLKTQEVANRSRSLEEMTGRVANTAHVIATFLAAQVPDAPSPQLAASDPAAYTRQRAFHEAAMQRLNQIVQLGGTPRQVAGHLNAEQQQALLAEENAKLVAAFPETGTAEGRERFFESAFVTGRELGFSDEEMQGFSDHRYLKVIHYARLGLAAERARRTAMEKVSNAPPSIPKVRQQAGAQAGRSRAAMDRLTKTGSLKDAMAIDF